MTEPRRKRAGKRELVPEEIDVGDDHLAKDDSPVELTICFCDDVRREVNGQTTLVGIHPRTVQFPIGKKTSHFKARGFVMVTSSVKIEDRLHVVVFRDGSTVLTEYQSKVQLGAGRDTLVVASPTLDVPMLDGGQIVLVAHLERTNVRAKATISFSGVASPPLSRAKSAKNRL